MELLRWALHRAEVRSDVHERLAAVRAALSTDAESVLTTAFDRAEGRALVAVADGAVDGPEVLRAATADRTGADPFDPDLYRLLADPPALPGLDGLLAVWREIIAVDADADPLDALPTIPTGDDHEGS